MDEFQKEMTLAGSKAFIGQPAPNFKTTAVVNGDFKEISLCQFKGKYVVLFFYPLDLYVPLFFVTIENDFKIKILRNFAKIFLFHLQDGKEVLFCILALLFVQRR